MSETLHSTCRLCDARCGRIAHLLDDGGVRFEPDPSDPVAGPFDCDLPTRSLAALADPRRLRSPLRRDEAGQLVPATWDEALEALGPRLSELRRRHGPRALGLYLGAPVPRRSRTLARALACGVALGTPNIFSTLDADLGPRLRLTELMLGQPTPLLSDIGRAHYVLVLGEDPLLRDWGPGQAGAVQAEALRFSRRTKGTKVVVASPGRGPLAAQADQHLAIRPGSETWLLLGLLSAIVKGGWIDAQYVRDYSEGIERLRALLSAFPAEECAAACGIEPAQLSGVALKFSRAAMAVVHPGHGCFRGEHGGIGAWAWLALHTVTANTLRPGGLYAHPGVVDLQLALQAVPTAQAPRLRASGEPLLLLQAPGGALVEEALTPGEDQLRALICVEGDPLLDQPDALRVQQALAGLDLLVCLSTWRSPATARAHWVLPVAHPWEEEELHLLDTMMQPADVLALAPALFSPPEGVRPSEAVLRELTTRARPGPRGSVYGAHLALGARMLAGAELPELEGKLLDWLASIDRASLDPPPHRLHRGDTNRAEWRVSHPDGKIRLVPPEVEPVLAALAFPRADAELPLWLRTSARRDRAPDPLHLPPGHEPVLFVPPALGLAEGERVVLRTRHGRWTGTARLDPSLRADAVELVDPGTAGAMALLPAAPRDPFGGAAPVDGLPCRVDPA